MKNFDIMPFASIGLIFIIMYFLVIRPQSKKAKEHQNMINALKKGDKIVTSGGVIGIITQVGDAEMELQVANNVRICVARNMVASLLSVENKLEEAAKTIAPKTVKTKSLKKK